IDWDPVKDWINFCKNHHRKHCKREEQRHVAGLRLIDCETRQIIQATDALDYITLSYVWGKSSEDEDPPNESSLPERVPRTIEHAVHVTKALGFRYLWVDRYCVPQHGPEKQRMIQEMDLVYENSELTLIAAAGETPAHGLPGIGGTSRKLRPPIQLGSHSAVVASFSLVEEIQKTKWNTRAWTYQEALLSRRKLVFSEQGMFFQCGAMQCFESLSLPLVSLHTKDLEGFRAAVNIPVAFPIRGVGKDSLEISDRINEYSKRDLTYDDDSLKAFYGIIQRFSKMILPLAHLSGV
ncbi:HET-domain-containing protein, partial [Mytilinidion resinicola]